MALSSNDDHRRLVVVRALWRMSRPDQIALVVVVFMVGVAAATALGGEPTADAFALGLVAVITTATSVHMVNEYADAETDALTRRTAFSGGSGALQDFGLPPRMALRWAAAAGVVSLAVTLIAVARESLSATAALLLGLGLLGGWQYSVRPLAFSRHGVGEVANALLGGLLLPLFGVAAVVGDASFEDAVLFVPFTLLVFVNLLETQWPDRAADLQVGKATLVTRLSPRAVRLLAAACTLTAYGVLPLATPTPIPVPVSISSAAALPVSLWALWRITRVESPLPAVLAMLTMIVAQGAAWVYLATA